MVRLAQLVRALVCGAGGRGFESRISPHNINKTVKRSWLNWIEQQISAL